MPLYGINEKRSIAVFIVLNPNKIFYVYKNICVNTFMYKFNAAE